MPQKVGAGQLIGVPGLSMWRGQVNEEYLTSLQGIRKYKVLQEMQDDVVIATLLDAMWMPLVSAEIDTIGASEAQADVDAAEFVGSCMHDMNQYEWRQHVVDMLSMMVYGWSISEMVFKKRLGTNALPSSKYNDGKIGLKIADPRGQETLERWEMDDEYNVLAFNQKDPNTGEIRRMEAWKLIHATFRSRKRSPEGTSPMRSLYRPWYTRKSLEIIEAIGAERDLAGLPKISLPYGASAADTLKAEELVRKIRLDEESGVVLPAPPTPDAPEAGWKLELMSGGSKMYNTREIIRDLNKIMLMRFFAQFLMLGMEQAGTQALVVGSHEFFTMALTSIQQELMEAWNLQMIPLLMKLNAGAFPGITGDPTMEWSPPGKKDITSVADMLTKLVGVNVITPEPQLEDFLRSMAGLPDRPEGVGEGPRQSPGLQPKPPPFPLAPQSSEFMAYDWYQLPGGEWLMTNKKPPKYGLGFDKIVTGQKTFASVLGTPGRKERGKLQKVTNDYQEALVMVFDSWSKKMKPQLLSIDKMSKSIDEIGAFVDEQLKELASSLKELGRDWIPQAVSMGFEKNLSPKGLKEVASQLEENEKYIDESLIPALKDRIMQHVEDSRKSFAKKKRSKATYQLDDLALGGLFDALRGRAGTYSGMFWKAFFIGVGMMAGEKDEKRVAEGGDRLRVRWVLDPAADHCEASPGFYGCEELEGEYDNWDAMPTVPAGEVTCRGNCRCEVEILDDEGGKYGDIHPYYGTSEGAIKGWGGAGGGKGADGSPKAVSGGKLKVKAVHEADLGLSSEAWDKYREEHKSELKQAGTLNEASMASSYMSTIAGAAGDNDPNNYIVAVGDDVNVEGAILAKRNKPAGRMEITFLAAAPKNMRGMPERVQGVGSSLVRGVFREAENEGFSSVQVFPTSSAKGFYEKVGFKWESDKKTYMSIDKKGYKEFNRKYDAAKKFTEADDWYEQLLKAEEDGVLAGSPG